MANETNTSPTTMGDRGADHPPGAQGNDPTGAENEAEFLNTVWKEFEDFKAYKHSQVNPADWKRYAMLYMAQHWHSTHVALHHVVGRLENRLLRLNIVDCAIA